MLAGLRLERSPPEWSWDCVRALAAGYYDGSLSSMLAELATACRYGDPVRETTTVELLDLVLDAVRSAPSALISRRGAAQTATATEPGWRPIKAR